MPVTAIDQHNILRNKSGRKGWLFSQRALAKIFRAKLLTAFKLAGFALPNDYPERWVVHCKSVEAGDKALAYLGRYLYRGLIREKDILRCENGQVTFRYRNRLGELGGKFRSLARSSTIFRHRVSSCYEFCMPKKCKTYQLTNTIHPTASVAAASFASDDGKR